MTLRRTWTRCLAFCNVGALALAPCLTPAPAAAQERPPAAQSPADSAWLLLRSVARPSPFPRLTRPPGPDPARINWYPLARDSVSDRSSSFMTGLMASAVTRAACGPNRVCRYYLEDAYEKEYGLIPQRAGWLGGLLGRALLPEFDRWGLNVGSAWWPARIETEP